MSKPRVESLGGEVTNGAAEELVEPYSAKVTIHGTAPFLFHRWNVEAVAEKAKAAKGSKSKKTDNVESYVWRMESRHLAIPGEYFRQSIIHAAKYMQDPRSPRKSAMDLFKAGLIMQTELADLGKSTWDYLDQRRVTVQRSGVTRVRPAMLAGWRVTFDLDVILPEYISRERFHDAIQNAGRLVGVGDFRPTYGRFQIIEFKA
jgi:hypothetical protein